MSKPTLRYYWEVQPAEPVMVRDLRVTPEARTLIVRLLGRTWVWQRPRTLLIEHREMRQRIPIVDATRQAQWVAFGVILGLGTVLAILFYLLRGHRDN